MKSVIDLAEQVKDYAAAGKTIAPVENGTTAVGSYAIGEKFIREGVLYKAKTSITAGDTLTLNTNYELEDNVVTQISDVKQALSNEVATRATLGAHNLIPMSLSWIKSNNTSGTWSGNTYTHNNIEFAITANGDSIEKINVNSIGTVSTAVRLTLTDYNFGDTSLSTYTGGGTPSSANGYTISGGENTPTSDSDLRIIYYAGGLTQIIVASAVSNKDVYPMIRHTSDPSSEYTPYAMTNKELTDVAKQVKGGYISLGYNEIYVTGDGVKTYGTLLDELYSALTAWCSNNLGNNDYIVIDKAKVAGGLGDFNVQSYDNKWTKASQTSLSFAYMEIGTSYASYIKQLELKSSGSSIGIGSVNVNGTAGFADYTSIAFLSGYTLRVSFDVYKKIS